MALKADAVAWIHGQTLHLVAASFEDVLESSPGAGLEAVGASLASGGTTSASGSLDGRH
jgi:hypothetical protein